MSSSTTEYTEEEAPVGLTPADDGPASVPQPSGEGDLLGDLLNLDLPPAPTGGGYNVPMMGGGADMDLLSGDLTGLYLGGPSGTGMISGQMQGAIQTGGTGGVGALAELLGTSVAGGSYVAPKQVWKRGGTPEFSATLFLSNTWWLAYLTGQCSHTSRVPFFLPSHPHFPPSHPILTFLPPTLSPPHPHPTPRCGWKLLRVRVWRSVDPGLADRARSLWT